MGRTSPRCSGRSSTGLGFLTTRRKGQRRLTFRALWSYPKTLLRRLHPACLRYPFARCTASCLSHCSPRAWSRARQKASPVSHAMQTLRIKLLCERPSSWRPMGRHKGFPLSIIQKANLQTPSLGCLVYRRYSSDWCDAGKSRTKRTWLEAPC